MSINFKNSIYSKIKYEPSVANLAPSMISARHQPMHSDASASQISTFQLTSKMMGRNGISQLNAGGSVEDAESEVPANSFIVRQKLLSSSSSPEIDIEEVMRRNKLQRSRLGSNRGNKSDPNIRTEPNQDDVNERIVHQFVDTVEGHGCDELSRRDLSARIFAEDPTGAELEFVTGFELGTQRSGEDEGSPRAEEIFARQENQSAKIDFSEKVQNLMSPENIQYLNQAMGKQDCKPDQAKARDLQATNDTSSNFLRQLQNLASPESTKNLSHRPNLLQ